MAHTRRGFLARIGAAAIGLTLASKLPGIASAPPRLDEPDTAEINVLGGHFKTGDLFTIAGDPTIYRVTNVVGSTLTFGFKDA